MVESPVLKKGYMFAVALFCWAGVGIILQNSISGKSGLEMLAALVGSLSYFTIQSNLLGALVLTIVLLFPVSAWGRRLAQPNWIGAITVYLMITFSIYALLLAGSWQPAGWMYFADLVLHYGVPLACLLFFVLFIPHGTLKWRDSLIWLVYPLGYALYTFIRGAWIDFYPYFFLDLNELGLQQTLINVLMLSIVFFLFGILLVAIDRGLGRWSKKTD